MSHDWTPERRNKRSEAIHRWNPWQKAKGPRTEQGKKVSSMNAYKHGMRSAEYRTLEALIAFYGRQERALQQEIQER